MELYFVLFLAAARVPNFLVSHLRKSRSNRSRHPRFSIEYYQDIMQRCAAANHTTIIATTITGRDDLPGVMALARSASDAGYPCVVALPFDTIPGISIQSTSGALYVLPPPDPPLLPRSMWCNISHGSQYVHRRRQFHRMRVWSLVLENGFDLLGIDPGRPLVRDPVPALAALTTRADEQYGGGRPPRVVGSTPGWYLKQYGLQGPMWIRSGSATRQLLRRVESRTRGAWDDLVFSEELNWGAGANATCCHSECVTKQFLVTSTRRHGAAGRRLEASGRRATTNCRADDSPPAADGPPARGRHAWPKRGSSKGWKEAGYNSLSIPLHRFGRCTGRDTSCVGLHPNCPPPPPPFTRAVSLAGKRREREEAKLRGERHRAERAKRTAANKKQHAAAPPVT